MSVGCVESVTGRIYANRFSEAELRVKQRLWKANIDGFFHRYIPRDGTVLDLVRILRLHQSSGRGAANRRRPESGNGPARRLRASWSSIICLSHRLTDAIEPDSVDLAFASNVFDLARRRRVDGRPVVGTARVEAGRAVDRDATQSPRYRREILGFSLATTPCRLPKRE